MMPVTGNTRVFIVACGWMMAILMSACAGPPPAPARTSTSTATSYNSTPDGYYRVRRGDSLHEIAFKFGKDWRDIAGLNGISAPWTIYPDQLLRLTESVQPIVSDGAQPSQSTGSSEVQIATVPSPTSTTSSVPDSPRSTTVTVAEKEPESASAPAQDLPAAVTPEPPTGSSQAPAGASYTIPAGDPARWIWPTEGKVISTFRANDPARKGVDISGSAGQAINAAAAGQVVYSGSGLIGYGELIIIKHSDRILSAYAHNSTRLVSEGDQVLAGGRIAKMGTNDRSQSVLHFEIRVNGSPQDPLKYLPRR